LATGTSGKFTGSRKKIYRLEKDSSFDLSRPNSPEVAGRISGRKRIAVQLSNGPINQLINWFRPPLERRADFVSLKVDGVEKA
jgi:hypothetical protein